MKIKHYPTFDTKKAEELYSERDGVHIKYVCSSALGSEAVSRDIFYRETPHPQFNNKYFGLFYHPVLKQLMISSADAIEDVEFSMVKCDDQWEYSRHRHDFRTLSNGVSIDGGRAYCRLVGDLGDIEQKTFKIVDGEFVEQE